MSGEDDFFGNVIKSQSIGEAFWARAKSRPSDLLMRFALSPHQGAQGEWQEESYASAEPKIARLASFLSTLGVGPGVPVAIMSQTRPEWILADLAIQSLGGITVSIYQSQQAQEAGFILYDSGARIVFVENEEQAAKLAWLQAHPCPIPQRDDLPESSARIPIEMIVSFEALETFAGCRLLRQIISDESLPSEAPKVPASLSRDSVASYVYTSGTTGPPKGVIQTHGNHLANVAQAAESGAFALNGSLFLYLPLAHSFARLIHYLGCLTSAHLALPAVADPRSSRVDLSGVAKDLQASSSFVIPSVPRLFEKMSAALKAKASSKGLQGKMLGLCISNAVATYERRMTGGSLSILEQIIFRGLEPVRAKVKRQLFGPKFSHAISGGAKLDPGVNRFFDALGMTICEGYGLTETCVATHVNRPLRRKIGTVGPPLLGVETRISGDDGEILLRGANVTQGYLNRPSATRESWDSDGWFHTGDVGSIDEQGFLTITDRKKELVITAGGKKIPPTSVEGRFKRFSFISHAFLFGDMKPYCVMLLTLNEQELRSLLRSAGIQPEPGQKLSELAAVHGMVQDAVDEVNAGLSSFESIKKFSILDEDFSVENGLLTPTLKMRRKHIVARHGAAIASLY